MYAHKNRLIFIHKFSPRINTMEGITILEHDERQNLIKKIVANKGIYKDGAWTFYQSVTYNFGKNGQVLDQPNYLEEEIMDIPETPQDFVSQGQRPDSMSIRQLKNYIGKLSRSGASTVIRNLKVRSEERRVGK